MATPRQPYQPSRPMKQHSPPSDALRLARILPLLACPACKGALRHRESALLHCTSCEASYPVRSGVPILLPASMQEPGVGSVDADDPVSMHPYSPASQDIIDANSDGWVLDLGAGGKLHRQEHVIQVDIFRYPMTDVVATADCLPFRDNAFKAVISQAVFEHLQYPEQAAAEVRRVLQPGGVAKIDTAFLQPEHGYPHHFYNATETGLRHWFRDFDIEWSGVEPYQHPQWSLSWFLAVYLDRIDPAQAQILREAKLGGILQALEHRAAGRLQDADAPILQALDALPAHELRTLAAGVSIRGRNPPKLLHAGSAEQELSQRGAAVQDVRKLLAARKEMEILRGQLAAQEEALVLAADRGNYLAQYYPDFNSLRRLGVRAWLQFRLAALLRLVLPASAWFALYRLVRGRRGAASSGQEPAQPFFSVIVDPQTPASLIDAFFSLTHQTYTGWELLVIEHPGQLTAVRRAMRDFAYLDQRVRLVQAAGDTPLARLGEAQAVVRGRYWINLPEGGVLVREAVRTIFTLVRGRPVTSAVIADFERTSVKRSQSMRCHGKPLEGHAELSRTEYSFTVHAASPAQAGQAATPAYIPEVLFRQTDIADVAEMRQNGKQSA